MQTEVLERAGRVAHDSDQLLRAGVAAAAIDAEQTPAMSGAVALVGEWVELDGALAQGARFTVPHAAALKADRMHKIGDQDRGNGHPPCRCWRCRGGIALAERPVLDRILARHLTRITPQESATFLSGWLANPRHGQEARTQLNAWLRIASGSSEPEPTYREFA